MMTRGTSKHHTFGQAIKSESLEFKEANVEGFFCLCWKKMRAEAKVERKKKIFPASFFT